MGKRDDLVGAYIGALQIRAIVVMTAKGGRPARIGSAPIKCFDLVDSFWFAKPQHAELVHVHVVDDLRAAGAARAEGWFDLPGAELRDTVANVAGYLGASFRSMSEIERDAGAAVDAILAQVESARLKGDLKQVNAAYKAHRQAQAALGKKAAPYSAHLAEFTRGLVVAAAQNATLATPIQNINGA